MDGLSKRMILLMIMKNKILGFDIIREMYNNERGCVWFLYMCRNQYCRT